MSRHVDLCKRQELLWKRLTLDLLRVPNELRSPRQRRQLAALRRVDRFLKNEDCAEAAAEIAAFFPGVRSR